MDNLLKRFLGYVRQDTSPDETSGSCPSSILQLLFAEKLAAELEKIGLSDVNLDGNGYVMASLPSNSDGSGKVIGFISHMDTSPEASSVNVNPQVHKEYDGGDIILNHQTGVKLSPSDFSELAGYKGQTIIT